MIRPTATVAVGLVLGLSQAACSQARPVEPNVRRQCTTWVRDVEPIMSARCDSCHAGAGAEADYRTDTYLDAIKQATAGDSASLLLQVVDPATADATHAPFATAVFQTLSTWVVDCQLGYAVSEVHGLGNLDPASSDFHGAVVAELGWNLDTCATCHGKDFAGGTSGVSCLPCHQGGPTSCTTCHAQPPATGAHLAHANGPTFGRQLDCVECHVKPSIYTDAGHLHPPPGHVTFGALAATTPTDTAAARSGPPAWDHATLTCANVYCHGAAFADTAATNTTPTWNTDSNQIVCGTCHGFPPSGHASTGTHCASCHSLVVQDDNVFVNPHLHIDGVVEFAGGTGCTTCHGQPPATGAHLAHMSALHELSGPVACSECHTVPATVDEPGHIGETAVLFPAGVGPLAATDGAMPAFDANTLACANVYCHGGGTHLAADTSPDLDHTPIWTGGTNQARCGACHGIPPADGIHAPSLQLNQCSTCHGATMDASGAIRIAADGTSTHINGVVDVSTR